MHNQNHWQCLRIISITNSTYAINHHRGIGKPACINLSMRYWQPQQQFRPFSPRLILYMSSYCRIYFSKTLLCANPKIDVAMPMLRSEITSWKRTLHKCVHIYIYTYTHMWKALYWNTIFEFSISIPSSFSRMALNAFWKRALRISLFSNTTWLASS